VTRRVGALACIGFAWLFAGCGGEDEEGVTSEKAVRECLAGSQIGLKAPGQAGPATGAAPVYAPDFTVYTNDGVSIDILVEPSTERARRTAADVRSALAGLETVATAGGGVVDAEGNAVAVFSAAPPKRDREAVRSCLDG
jgi:hypothetical protein